MKDSPHRQLADIRNSGILASDPGTCPRQRPLGLAGEPPESIQQGQASLQKIQPVLAAAVLLAVSGAANAALVCNLPFLAGTRAQAQQAFVDAGARWGNLFAHNITLDMTVGTASLGSGMLAQAGSRSALFGYSNSLAALTADQGSTSDNPNGSGASTPCVDTTGANNSSIRLTTANAKALGLVIGWHLAGAVWRHRPPFGRQPLVPGAAGRDSGVMGPGVRGRTGRHETHP